MVRTGHAAEIVPVAYRNSARPSSGIEVMRLSDIVARATAEHMAQVQRVEFHLVALFVAGRCTHTVDFQPHRCRPGTVLHAQPGQVQRWDLTAGLEAHVVVFTPEFLFPERPRAGELWTERFFDDVAWPTAIDARGDDHTTNLDWFTRLARTYDAVDDSPASATLLRHLLAVVLLDLARRCRIGQPAPGDPTADHARVRRFKLEVDRSFRVSRRVLDYAERMQCSAKTLDRACRALLGRSAKHYLDQRVTLEAKRLLAHTSLSVAAIGEAVGFSEPTNFVKFFKARERELPGAFRDRLRPASSAGTSRASRTRRSPA